MAIGEQEYYARSTSDPSVKLIIDLFNRLNRHEGFTMKTITTIYKENDIFSGNSRYPIDAPFQPFYVQLTEEYVLKYKLDDLFFENQNIKTGEFYFEFSYNELENKIIISKYPESLIEVKEKVRSYVPMLFSMISGREIDWEEARKKLIFEQGITENKFKILVVFGEDQMRTLNFSWLGTFEINDDVDVEIVSNRVREQRKEIVNSIQGVLFSELETVFIDFISINAKSRQVRDFLSDYGHTIKNLGFKSSLNELYFEIENNNKLLPYYNRIENNYLIQQIATEVLITNQLSVSHKSETDNSSNFTFVGLIDLFHKASKYSEDKIFEFNKLALKHEFNIISSHNFPSVFTLLFNLFSNASKHNAGKILITALVNHKKEFKIEFKNNGDFPPNLIKYLKKEKTQKKDKIEGLAYIQKALKMLSDKINIDITKKNNLNTITLTIIKAI